MLVNASVLSGYEFEFIEESHLAIENGAIRDIGEGYTSGALDYTGFIAMPSFFNAHTHIGDSFAKEAVLRLNVDEAVGRKGLKWKLYKESTREERIDAMRETLDYMISSGTTAFADFREQGLEGIREIKEALEGGKIKSVILGRDVSESECDGIGVNTYQTEQIRKDRKKIAALHAGENEGEVRIALKCKPDIAIHFTKATTSEIKQATKQKMSIVVCPSSNSMLGVGFPKVREMIDAGLNVALGTDNVMISQPDLFNEMRCLFKTSMLMKQALTPEEVLRMATCNGAKAFGMKTGLLKKGFNADFMFIDKNAPGLRYSRNIKASLVNRCCREDVRKIMIDGNIVLDKDSKRR
jgi:cytosine/adenosine deaminase-related metal-dependent hydrolase